MIKGSTTMAVAALLFSSSDHGSTTKAATINQRAASVAASLADVHVETDQAKAKKEKTDADKSKHHKATAHKQHKKHEDHEKSHKHNHAKDKKKHLHQKHSDKEDKSKNDKHKKDKEDQKKDKDSKNEEKEEKSSHDQAEKESKDKKEKTEQKVEKSEKMQDKEVKSEKKEENQLHQKKDTQKANTGDATKEADAADNAEGKKKETKKDDTHVKDGANNKNEEAHASVVQAEKLVKKAAKALKAAETTAEKKAGLEKLKAAQDKRAAAEQAAEDQHFATEAEKEAAANCAKSPSAEDAPADKDLSKLTADEVARVKQAEADGKKASTVAAIAFEKALKDDQINLDKITAEERKKNMAEEALKNASTAEEEQKAHQRLKDANALYKEALQDRIESKEALLKASKAKASAVLKDSKATGTLSVLDAEQQERDGQKVKKEAEDKVAVAAKAVEKADDPVGKEKAHAKLLEAKQHKLEAKAMLKKAREEIELAKKDVDEKEAQAAVESELDKEDAHAQQETPLPSAAELEADKLKSKQKKLNNEVDEAVQDLESSTATATEDTPETSLQQKKSIKQHRSTKHKKHTAKKEQKHTAFFKHKMNQAHHKKSHHAKDKHSLHEKSEHKQEDQKVEKNDQKEVAEKHQITADELANATDSPSQSTQAKEESPEVTQQAAVEQNKVSTNEQNQQDMKEKFEKSDTFKQYEEIRNNEKKNENSESSENEKVNKELAEMKSKFKHLMSDYSTLQHKVHNQHVQAEKFDRTAFRPEEIKVYNTESSKGIEEARQLVGVVLNIQPHDLSQKTSPVSGPATVADGHSPRPVGGIAKPKAKGIQADNPKEGTEATETPKTTEASDTPKTTEASDTPKNSEITKKITEISDSTKGLTKKGTLPPAGPAGTATGHQPTPVGGIAKPKAKGKRSVQSSNQEPAQQTESETSTPKQEEKPSTPAETETQKSQNHHEIGHRAQRRSKSHLKSSFQKRAHSLQKNQHNFEQPWDGMSQYRQLVQRTSPQRLYLKFKAPVGDHQSLKHKMRQRLQQIRSAPVSHQQIHLRHATRGHPHRDHNNIQLGAKHYMDPRSGLDSIGTSGRVSLHEVQRYEGEINEDKRLFDFEQPGDF